MPPQFSLAKLLKLNERNLYTMQRHWLPAIVIGLTVLLAVVFAVVIKMEPKKAPPVPIPVEAPVTQASYQEAVTAILTTYKENSNEKAAYDALVVVRVPNEDQQLHLDLVIAFGKLLAGDRADGEARLAALRAQHTWLPM